MRVPKARYFANPDQIVTVEQALTRGPDTVQTRIRHADTYKAAPREKRETGQGRFDI